MRLPHHLLRHASGVFHFRLVVPRDLHGAVGLRVIKRSLRTRDPRTAQTAAWELSASYARAFTVLRGKAMANRSLLDDAVAALTEGKAMRYERDSARGFVKTDGPEDHAQLMDYLAAEERLARTKIEAHQQERALHDARAHADSAEMVARTDLQQALADKAAEQLKRLEAAIPFPAEAGSSASGFTVRNMITHWEAVEVPDMLAATAVTRKTMIENFAVHFGEHRPIRDVRRTDVASWDAAQAKSGNSKGTRKGKASHLKMFFECAGRSGHYPIELHGNPAEGAVKFTKGDKKARAKSHGWEAFTLPQLQTLFAPANLKRAREPHNRRAMVMGLFTGARVGEVAQLKLTQFKIEDGVKCLHITGALKTEASERLIPIHPDLLRLGLWEWKEEQEQRKETHLFPLVKLTGRSKGNAISKGTSNLLDLLKIAPEDGKTTRLGFHSFRDTIVQHLQSNDAEGVREERRRAYVGHAQYEKRDTSAHATAYMRKWSPKEIQALEAGITWGQWLDIDGLRDLLAKTDSDATLKRDARKAKRAVSSPA